MFVSFFPTGNMDQLHAGVREMMRHFDMVISPAFLFCSGMAVLDLILQAENLLLSRLQLLAARHLPDILARMPQGK